MDVPIAETGTGLLSCLLGNPALALGGRGRGWGEVGGGGGQTLAPMKGGSEMQFGGGVSTWSWLHRLRPFQMC